MSKTFRYILHSEVPSFAAQGWIAHDSLEGTHHGQYSTLMEYVGKSSRTAASGQQGIRPGSHYAPYSTHTRRDSSFSLPSALPLWPPGRTLSGQENESASFHASGASFERSQIAQAMLDVGALLFVSIYGLLYIAVIFGLIPFAVFCLFFVSFH